LPEVYTETSEPEEVDAPEPEEPEEDDGPSAEELADAEVPGPREEKPAKEERPAAPDPRDQQIENLNRAMRQARHEKRAARQEAAALRDRQQRIEQRQQLFMQRLAEANGVDISDLVPTPARVPEADADPIGHLTARFQQTVAPLQQKIEELEQQLTTRELNGQVEAVDRYVADDAAAFHGEHPDYAEAEDFVLESMARGAWNAAKDRYPDADDDDLAEHVGQYVGRAIGNLKVGAWKDRKSLASIVYAVAQKQGWQPGQAPPVREAGRPAPRGKVGELARNLQRSGATVNGLERSPRKAGPLSAAALLDMDDDEFEAVTSKPGAWKKMAERLAT